MWTKQDYVTLFWAGLGALVAFGSYRLGIGRLLEPGPGLMPFVLGVVMCVLALAGLAGRRRAAARTQPGGPGKENGTGLRKGAGKIAATTAGLFAYAFLLEPLGYLITTFLVLAFLFKVAGYRGWVRVLPYAVAITLVSYLGFGYLGTRFPPGLLSFPGM